MLCTHFIENRKKKKRGRVNWRHDVGYFSFHMWASICRVVAITFRWGVEGVTKVQQQAARFSNKHRSLSLQNIRSLCSFCYFFPSIWRPFFFVSVYVCPAVSHSTPGKNNKPRDTIQILDVISLLSGSKREKDRGKCVHIYIYSRVFPVGACQICLHAANQSNSWVWFCAVCVCVCERIIDLMKRRQRFFPYDCPPAAKNNETMAQDGFFPFFLFHGHVPLAE